jgi:FkbM family methyltransferase
MRHVAQRFGLFIGEFPPPLERLDDHVRLVLHTLDINCVLDVGAHYGEYATSLRKHGYTGRLVSFEPVEDAYRKCVTAATGDPNWLVRRLALGAQEADIPINILPVSAMNSFAVPSSYASAQLGQRVAITDTEIVPMRRLDSVFADAVQGIAHPRVYLKMDTQGYDLEVVRGAAQSMPHVLALQSELAVTPLYEATPRMADAIETLEGLGFSISNLFVLTLDKQMRAMEFDCVMVRATT